MITIDNHPGPPIGVARRGHGSRGDRPAALERYAHRQVHLNRTECHTRADKLSVARRRVMGDLVAAAPDRSVPEVCVDVASTTATS